MKRIIFSFIVIAIAIPALAQLQAVNSVALISPGTKASFQWISVAYDFGKIPMGKPVTYEFKFTNTGTEPLVISSVQASCGCTVAEYSRLPVEPGAEGFVKATYNAAKPGVFTKTVTVNANTEDGVVLLTIKGEVAE